MMLTANIPPRYALRMQMRGHKSITLQAFAITAVQNCERWNLLNDVQNSLTLKALAVSYEPSIF